MSVTEATSGLEPGRVLAGRYRLRRLLGSGGMAIVWLADDQVLRRPVAIKIPADVLAADPSYLDRFKREAKTAARLSHPNLVGVFDYSDNGEERPFLVMEYVEGATLDQIADSRRGRRVDAKRLARELLDALEHIHDAGIVHRDVKPSNVIVTKDGRARLTDFGIAQPDDGTAITETGKVIGSRGYIAPEVLAGKRATRRSDLYSAGTVLADHLGPKDDPRLRQLIADLRAEDPGNRPRTAADALRQLGIDTTTPPPRARTAPTIPSLSSIPGAAKIKAQPALAALIAVALVGVILISAVSGGGLRDSPPDRGADAAAGSLADDGGGGTSGGGGDPGEGARLNDEGYELIQGGRPEEAVPVLQQAVEKFLPDNTDDLNYAYALFNLGNALRLSGDPEAAIPILEQRATIDNQREEVLAELEKAREEAGED